MARPKPPAEMEFPGSDSFLDVVINIVGILIILVVAIGVKSRQAGIATSGSGGDDAPPSAVQTEAVALQTDIARSVDQLRAIENEIAARAIERGQLSDFLVAADNELKARRNELGTQARRQFDLNRELRIAEATLERLRVERSAVEAITAPTVKVESYPTPLSRTVEGRELHFQLKRGRLVYIPLDELIDKFKNTARDKAWKMKDEDEMTDTLGPIQDFRLRYTLERVDLSTEMAMRSGQHGSFIQLARWELLPVSSDLGEPVDLVLAPDSTFHARLAKANPHQWTVTLWIYPDSFDLFRAVRKDLYHAGYSIAARPLPDNVPIGGSPRGSKSAAQ